MRQKLSYGTAENRPDTVSCETLGMRFSKKQVDKHSVKNCEDLEEKHMKRIVALIMAVAVLFVSSAYAESIVIEENFSIRNGITFGMKADEIHQIEIANGNKVATGDDSFGFLFPCDAEYITRLGGESCVILYFTDKNNILSGFRYLIPTIDTYNSIENSLSEKYGKAETTKLLPFETEISEIASDYLMMDPTITMDGSWLVQYQDCYVYIVASTLKMKNVSPLYRVDYTILSYDEVATVFLLLELAEQESQKSLDDGL